MITGMGSMSITRLLQAGLLVKLSVQHLMDTSDKTDLAFFPQNCPVNLAIQALSIIRSSGGPAP